MPRQGRYFARMQKKIALKYVLNINAVPAARQRECNLTRFRNFRSISRGKLRDITSMTQVLSRNAILARQSRFFSRVPLNKLSRLTGLVSKLVTCFNLPYKLKIIIAISHESTILQKKTMSLASFCHYTAELSLGIEWTMLQNVSPGLYSLMSLQTC